MNKKKVVRKHSKQVSNFAAQMLFPTRFHSNRDNKAGIITTLKYGITCLLALLLVWQQSSVVAAPRSSLTHETFAISSSNDFSTAQILPQKSPVKNLPAPQGEEIPYENELEEDVDNDWNLLLGYSSESISNQFFQGNDFSHAATVEQNDSSVPYFILYHSWKSFLS